MRSVLAALTGCIAAWPALALAQTFSPLVFTPNAGAVVQPLPSLAAGCAVPSTPRLDTGTAVGNLNALSTLSTLNFTVGSTAGRVGAAANAVCPSAPLAASQPASLQQWVDADRVQQPSRDDFVGVLAATMAELTKAGQLQDSPLATRYTAYVDASAAGSRVVEASAAIPTRKLPWEPITVSLSTINRLNHDLLGNLGPMKLFEMVGTDSSIGDQDFLERLPIGSGVGALNIGFIPHALPAQIPAPFYTPAAGVFPGVGMLVYASDTSPAPNHRVALDLHDHNMLVEDGTFLPPCPDPTLDFRLIKAPRSYGFCSGFLVSVGGQTEFATAAHCLAPSCKKGAAAPCDVHPEVVFGFNDLTPVTTPSIEVPADNVFTIEAIDPRSPAGQDIVLATLDRPVPPAIAMPFTVDRQPIAAFPAGVGLIMVGYPSSLPKMIDTGEPVMLLPVKDDPHERLVSTDSYHGDSGAPLFDVATGHVVGMIKEGMNDYRRDAARNCAATVTETIQQSPEVAYEVASIAL